MRKLKATLIYTLAIIFLIGGLSFNVLAATGDTAIPAYVALRGATISLSISSSGQAATTAYMRIQNTDYKVKASVSIERSKDQSSWITMKTWLNNFSGSTVYTTYEEYDLKSGYYYRARLSIRIYDTAGDIIETIKVYSQIKYY